MPGIRLTPGQARALGERLTHAAALVRRLADAVRETARRLAQILRPIVDRLQQLGVVPPADRGGCGRRRPAARLATDRPAWASPYGPAPNRHR
ncbi:hypothetical protein ACFOOM_01170 [Streptomyces echinoruber]|uniref:Uncharacterized protein n=1 Tax=Streptomyces echinoruber TaxID=68898 RepID=A0A918V7K1_9ACTN|nr:hypothetical protein [Streptomyces echinoruber]GGZ72987.1 hypothetical protein GCM10010389_07990 [Streptomyces echinoruber]